MRRRRARRCVGCKVPMALTGPTEHLPHCAIGGATSLESQRTCACGARAHYKDRRGRPACGKHKDQS